MNTFRFHFYSLPTNIGFEQNCGHQSLQVWRCRRLVLWSTYSIWTIYFSPSELAPLISLVFGRRPQADPSPCCIIQWNLFQSLCAVRTTFYCWLLALSSVLHLRYKHMTGSDKFEIIVSMSDGPRLGEFSETRLPITLMPCWKRKTGELCLGPLDRRDNLWIVRWYLSSCLYTSFGSFDAPCISFGEADQRSICEPLWTNIT